jgi:predicted anti-sigma-YlaC factor YlaD
MNKVLENIAHKMFYTCEQATFMIEKKVSTQGIGIMENIRLKIHLSMCKFCRAYNKKVAIMDKVMLNFSKKENKKIDESEINDFKDLLKTKILQ